MSDVQIAIDVKSCVDHDVSPVEFEQKLKEAITGLGLTVEIEERATHFNILGMHPLGCSELIFASNQTGAQQQEVYEIVVNVFHDLKQK